jgi:hypothetical protein
MGGFMILIWSFMYVAILIVVVYVVYKWVTTFISLKREHNDLLREILKKMDKGEN